MKRMLTILAAVMAAAAVRVAQGSVAYSDPFALKSGSGGNMSVMLSRFLSRSHTSMESDRLPTFNSNPNIGLFIVIH